MRPILIEISPGELIDRITILQLKAGRIDAPRRPPLQRELDQLLAIRAEAVPASPAVEAAAAELAAVNRSLWEVEDDLRRCEERGEFGDCFVQLARSVYLLNDRRSRFKRQINELLGASVREEKIYTAGSV